MNFVMNYAPGARSLARLGLILCAIRNPNQTMDMANIVLYILQLFLKALGDERA